MITVSIARRYAKALLSLATEQGQLEPVSQALEGVAHALRESSDLRNLMTNPAFTVASRQQVVGALLGRLNAPVLATHTIQLLVSRGRGADINMVARAFRAMLDEQLGHVRAKLTSAIPLDAAAVEQIRLALAAVTRKQVSIEKVVDPAILGGVVAQVGSTTFDGSLQTQLHGLKRQLLA